LKLEQDMGTGENSRAASQEQLFKAFLDKSGWEVRVVNMIPTGSIYTDSSLDTRSTRRRGSCVGQERWKRDVNTFALCLTQPLLT
jgi:hypothetical protein